MARVIKAGAPGTARPARAATRVLAHADARKVIEREMYAARQEAEELLRRADEERREILAEGKRQAAQAREEAMSRGASEAFAAAAQEALAAFRRRAERYGEAADDIRTLALEIVKKILGTEPDLGQQEVERVLNNGLTQLRARRKLRVQVNRGRRDALMNERPNLMRTLDAEPDLVVEGVDDVRVGFARVLTEVGGALCAEDAALDALAVAVNVRETPREGMHRSASVTSVGPMRTDSSVALPPRDDSEADSTHLEHPRAPAVRTPRAPVRPASSVATGPLIALPDAGVSADASEELPDAAIMVFDDDDDDESTSAIVLPVAALATPPKAPLVPARAPAPVVTSTPPRVPRPLPAADQPRSRPDSSQRIEASPRPRQATRALRLDEQELLAARARTAGPERVDLGADDDDDLALFTDDRVVTPRRP